MAAAGQQRATVESIRDGTYEFVSSHLSHVKTQLVVLSRAQHLRVYMVRHRRAFALLALAAGVLAFGMRDPEAMGLACDPGRQWWAQLHGYWHVLLAFAMAGVWWQCWTEDAHNRSWHVDGHQGRES